MARWLWERFRRFYRRMSWRLSLPRPTEPAERVYRKRLYKKRRTYAYTAGTAKKKSRFYTRLAVLLLGSLCLYSAFQLISYGVDYVHAQRASATLREIYYAQQTMEADDPATPSLTPTAMIVPTPSSTAVQTSATPTPAAKLETVRYPDNPQANVSSRFQKIQRQNSDIIGWLTIENLIDEAVVQRDNAYYLGRDYRGYHNVNGAIFLEETCDLRTRPYTLTLYGHNMKTGMMFGCLRNYENLFFYKHNPFITFDTAYEDGRYVIFAVSTISMDAHDRRYVDFTKLHATWVEQRQEALDALLNCSLYRTPLEVTPQDQLLMLVTCADEDDLRRVVAARRIREDEDEATLTSAIQWTITR